jgi:hypothetical protein
VAVAAAADATSCSASTGAERSDSWPLGI